MSKQIKITPEELTRIGERFVKCSELNRTMATELKGLIGGVSGQWEGVSKERFYDSYSDAEKELENVSVLLSDVGEELKAIALRFKTVDETK